MQIPSNQKEPFQGVLSELHWRGSWVSLGGQVFPGTPEYAGSSWAVAVLFPLVPHPQHTVDIFKKIFKKKNSLDFLDIVCRWIQKEM